MVKDVNIVWTMLVTTGCWKNSGLVLPVTKRKLKVSTTNNKNNSALKAVKFNIITAGLYWPISINCSAVVRILSRGIINLNIARENRTNINKVATEIIVNIERKTSVFTWSMVFFCKIVHIKKKGIDEWIFLYVKIYTK